MSKEGMDTVELIRDKEGKITSIEFPLGVNPEIASNFLLVGLIDSVNRSIKELDATNKKYSERMERLTVVLVGLTTVLGSLTIVDILLRVIIHA
jgi:hypothetical protein